MYPGQLRTEVDSKVESCSRQARTWWSVQARGVPIPGGRQPAARAGRSCSKWGTGSCRGRSCKRWAGGGHTNTLLELCAANNGCVPLAMHGCACLCCRLVQAEPAVAVLSHHGCPDPHLRHLVASGAHA